MAGTPSVETLGGLTLVDQAARGAACLDGSPPGYWMRRATVAADAARWVIHAQGGGWCYDDALCAARAKGRIGSSASWGATTSCYGSCDGILSANATSNPDFAGWNAVFLGYCDGTSFKRERDERWRRALPRAVVNSPTGTLGTSGTGRRPALSTRPRTPPTRRARSTRPCGATPSPSPPRRSPRRNRHQRAATRRATATVEQGARSGCCVSLTTRPGKANGGIARCPA